MVRNNGALGLDWPIHNVDDIEPIEHEYKYSLCNIGLMLLRIIVNKAANTNLLLYRFV